MSVNFKFSSCSFSKVILSAISEFTEVLVSLVFSSGLSSSFSFSPIVPTIDVLIVFEFVFPLPIAYPAVPTPNNASNANAAADLLIFFLLFFLSFLAFSFSSFSFAFLSLSASSAFLSS